MIRKDISKLKTVELKESKPDNYSISLIDGIHINNLINVGITEDLKYIYIDDDKNGCHDKYITKQEFLRFVEALNNLYNKLKS